MVVTFTLVPVKLNLCGLVALSSKMLSVADSLVPAEAEGENVSVIVQEPPAASAVPFAHVPFPVLDQSPALVPVMVK